MCRCAVEDPSTAINEPNQREGEKGLHTSGVTRTSLPVRAHSPEVKISAKFGHKCGYKTRHVTEGAAGTWNGTRATQSTSK